MDSSKLNDWLQPLGMAGIIASLVFVGVQINQTEEIATIEIINDGTERQISVATLIAENADVWQRGCMAEELTDAEATTFISIFRAYQSHKYAAWARFTRSEIGGGNPESVVNLVAANAHRYPGFRAAMQGRAAFRGKFADTTFRMAAQFTADVEKRMDEYAEIEPNPDFDVRYCGE